MPAQFEGFGIKFLYPENWKEVADPGSDEGNSFTIESPGGAYFSVSLVPTHGPPEDVVEEALEVLNQEYGGAERDEVPGDAPPPFDEIAGADLGFFYLDLLVTARVVAWSTAAGTLMVQMQAESREFDQQEQVFAAMLASMRGALPGAEPE